MGVTASDVNGTGQIARAQLMASTLPVRPADPVKERFQVGERQDSASRAGQAETPNAEAFSLENGDAAFTAQGGEKRGSSGGFGLLGAVTNFLTRLFAQQEPNNAQAAAALAGTQAYRRTAEVAARPLPQMDIATPSLPRLSSGRALDLTV